MGSSEKDANQLLSGAIRRRIEQNQQQNPQAKINRSEPDQPGAFTSMQSEEKQEGDQRHESIDPVKLLDNAGAQHAQLRNEPHRVLNDIGGIGLLVLAARERMEETLHCARISPL